MRRLFVGLIWLFVASESGAQQSLRPEIKSPAEKKEALAPQPSGQPKKGEAITTQIYSDAATFDSEKRIGIFTGHVRVFDPRFNIQSDKMTVYIHKVEGEGLEKAIAEGHVGVVRAKTDPKGGPARPKPDPKGGPASQAVGLSEKAVYTSSDGNVVLTGSPRVQQGLDTHVATSADTVMILNQDGQLTTKGPSRTEIRQEGTDQKNGVPGSSPSGPVSSPAPTPKP